MPRGQIREALAATPKAMRLGGKEPRLDIDLPHTDRGFIAHPFVHGVPERKAGIHSSGRLVGRTGRHI